MNPVRKTASRPLAGLCLAALLAGAALAAPPGEEDYRQAAAALKAGDYAAAHAGFLKAAEAGQVSAMVDVGIDFQRGQGTEVDLEQARTWFQRAADLGDAGAKRSLERLARPGYSEMQQALLALRQQRGAEAVALMRSAADKGYVNALFELGICYQKGCAGAKDPEQALKWFMLGAEQGHPGAMYSVGLAYDNGKGVAKDPVQADAWYRRAAEQGHASAMMNLAAMLQKSDPPQAWDWIEKAAGVGDRQAAFMTAGRYYLGQNGASVDMARAAQWYRKAAEAGDAEAMVNLGGMLRQGQGLAASELEARRWYVKAAGLGNARAQEQLAKMPPGGEAEYQAALKLPRKEVQRRLALYTQAAEQGHPGGIAALAFMYGSPYEAGDANQARYWFSRAAESGNPLTLVSYSDYLLRGIGGPKDVPGAILLLENAAASGQNGSTEAMNRLHQLYEEGTFVPRDAGKSMYWLQLSASKGDILARQGLEARGTVQRNAAAQEFIDRIHRDGPNPSTPGTFGYDVAVYCIYKGPRCDELKVQSYQFQTQWNAQSEAANRARLSQVYSTDRRSQEQRDRAYQARSACLQGNEKAIRNNTYGQADYSYRDGC